jgi:predicted phage tail protein
MKLESLNCNHCGAPLDVPGTTNFVTCNHCGSKLAVRCGENATYTELMGAVSEPLQEMASQLGHIAHEKDLERIDREWELEREQYLVADKQGVRQVPDTASSVIGGVVVTVFGLIWTVMAFSITSGFNEFGGPGGFASVFPLFGVVFVLAGIGMSIYSYPKAQQYQQAYERYQTRRAAVRSEKPGGHQGHKS